MQLLVFALLLGTSRANSCSRSISRKVRRIIQKDVFEKFSIKPEQLSANCPLNPKFDLYLDQEQHKEEVSYSEWQCKYCNKKFVDEFYLDRHMDNLHQDKIQPNATICLADLCPIFGCNSQEKRQYISNNDYEDYRVKQKKSFAALQKCTTKDTEISRHSCEILSEKCFSQLPFAMNKPKTGKILSLEEKFNSLVCDNLRCINGVLKGAATYDNESPSILIWVAKVTIATVIIFLISLYVIFSGLYKVFFKSIQVKSEDHLLRQYQNQKGYTGWLKRYITSIIILIKDYIKKLSSSKKD
eukprot:gene10694-14361_t